MSAVKVHRQGPETERLLLRAFEPTDAEAFFRLNSDPEVMRYTGEPMPESVASARAGIAAYPDWERYGYGRWAAIFKATREIIGFAGLKFLEDLQQVDLGYRFLPAYWGQGLATEASRACLRFGFESLKLERIIGLADSENRASIRVLAKVGMSRLDPIHYEDEIVEHYAITRAQYHALSVT